MYHVTFNIRWSVDGEYEFVRTLQLDTVSVTDDEHVTVEVDADRITYNELFEFTVRKRLKRFHLPLYPYGSMGPIEFGDDCYNFVNGFFFVDAEKCEQLWSVLKSIAVDAEWKIRRLTVT